MNRLKSEGVVVPSENVLYCSTDQVRFYVLVIGKRDGEEVPINKESCILQEYQSLLEIPL